LVYAVGQHPPSPGGGNTGLMPAGTSCTRRSVENGGNLRRKRGRRERRKESHRNAEDEWPADGLPVRLFGNAYRLTLPERQRFRSISLKAADALFAATNRA
jgi:hypothetical protein